MKKHSIGRVKDELKKLIINESVTEEQAEASMRILQNFNQCMIGLSHFSGTTPWECHEDDEFLQVLDGKVEVLVLNGTNKSNELLQSGDCFVVPKTLWHRQMSSDGAKIMFITSIEGNKMSMDEYPV